MGVPKLFKGLIVHEKKIDRYTIAVIGNALVCSVYLRDVGKRLESTE